MSITFIDLWGILIAYTIVGAVMNRFSWFRKDNFGKDVSQIWVFVGCLTIYYWVREYWRT